MFQVDVFGASLVRSLPNEFDKSGNGNRLAGAYATSTKAAPAGDGRTVRVLAPRHQSPKRARDAGHALTDHRGHTDRRAVAGEVGLRRRDGSATRRPRPGLHHARGRDTGNCDRRCPGGRRRRSPRNTTSRPATRVATDGSRQTFDQLYPTGHDKLGLADQVGWRNIHHLREGIEITPIKATPISLNYHSWWLASDTDGLYSAGGDAAGPASRRWRSKHARRAGDRPAGDAFAHAAASARRRLRTHHQRRLSEGSDTRCLVQLPIRDGHVCFPGGEIDEHTTSVYQDPPRPRRAC